jgi:hypothetical protein
MSRWAVGTAALVCLLAAVPFARFLIADRELVAATPSPRPVFAISLVDVPPAEALCISGVTIPDDARELHFQVGTFGPPGPALTVDLRAPGYAERVTVPAGYADSALIAEPMRPPAAPVLGEVCFRHEGARKIALVGTTEERTRSRPEGAVSGQPVDPDAYLAFYAGRSASALSQSGEIVARMGAFRPGVVGPWLLWPLLAVVVIGVPAGLLWAILRAH